MHDCLEAYKYCNISVHNNAEFFCSNRKVACMAIMVQPLSFDFVKVAWQPRAEGIFPEMPITTPKNAQKPKGIIVDGF